MLDWIITETPALSVSLHGYLLIHYLILSGPCWQPHLLAHIDFPLAQLTVILVCPLPQAQVIASN